MTIRNISLSLSVILFGVLAKANMQCEHALKPQKSESEIIRFIDGGHSLRGGERNANIFGYFKSNIDAISPSGLVTLVKALVPEGAMLSSSQFSQHISKKYAQENMIQMYIDRHRPRLTEKEIEYFQDLLAYGL